MKTLLILALLISGCATSTKLSNQAKSIQVIEQDSVLISKCKMIGSVNSVKTEILPADNVYNLALADTLEQAAALGADAITITNVEHSAWIANAVRIQSTALNCYH